MNKKLFGALCLAIACVGAVAYSSQYFINDSSRNAMMLGDVEALSSCEITKGDKVKFKCTDNTGECSISGFGATLKCSGKKVAVK